MKKIVLALAVAVISAAALLIMINAGSGNKNAVEKKTEAVKPTPLVIDNSKESSGKITIYQDAEVAYEYQGPIKVWRRNGEYFIEVHTFQCSCVENMPDAQKEKLEVEENE